MTSRINELWKHLSNTVREAVARDRSSPSGARWFFRVFLFLHFVAGFFFLWLAYFQILSGLDYLQNARLTLADEGTLQHSIQVFAQHHARSNGLLLRSFLESGFIVVCVVWGNLGWDRMRRLQRSLSEERVMQYFFKDTAYVLLALPILILGIEVLFSYAQGFPVARFVAASSWFVWILVLAGTAVCAYKQRKARRATV